MHHCTTPITVLAYTVGRSLLSVGLSVCEYDYINTSDCTDFSLGTSLVLDSASLPIFGDEKVKVTGLPGAKNIVGPVPT